MVMQNLAGGQRRSDRDRFGEGRDTGPLLSIVPHRSSPPPFPRHRWPPSSLLIDAPVNALVIDAPSLMPGH